MPRFIVMRMSAAAVAIVLLNSCGGGGGGGTPSLSITAASPPAGTTGAAYPGYTFLASGGTPPLTWTSGPLPPGFGLSTSGQLSGTPATAGTYPISVTAADSSMPPLTASAPVSLKVNDSAIVVTTSPSPPAGTVTYPYFYGFTASGGSPPYTWQASGALPPGLSLLPSDGTVSGTPSQAGSFPFSVTATDSAQTPVSGPPLATQITINIPSTLTLNAMPAPPAGVDGTPYGPFSFSATGGFLPLKWGNTGLPPFLSLGPSDGVLTGTPTSIGTFNFTVTVTDSRAPTPATSSLPFRINIAAPPPPAISNSEPPTGTVGSVYAPFQFTATGGLAPLNWSETPLLTGGLSLSTPGVLSGSPTVPQKTLITLNVTDALSQPAPSVQVVVRVSLPHPGSFSVLSAVMTTPRSGHTATLLNTGTKVLIAGGANGVADASAELYDHATKTFTATAGSMTEARIGHTATLLNDSALANYGKVLIVGPVDTTAELYNPDPATGGTFTATGGMHHPRTAPTATLLSNTGLNAGKVLIVGGNTTSGDLVAELYDPGSGTFTDTGSTTILRAGHTATLLTAGPPAGQVLIAGGSGSASAELYNPATGMFTRTADMTAARTGHTATALGTQDGAQNGAQNGAVLIVGIDGSADLYDPSTAKFTAVGSFYPSISPATFSRTTSLRTDGTVLVAGGTSPRARYRLVRRGFHHTCVYAGTFPQSTGVAALFAPESDGFTQTASLNTSRDGHTATVLADGAVLVVGGTQHTVGSPYCAIIPPPPGATVLSSAELFK